MGIIIALTAIGILVLLADDGFIGLSELVNCPVLYFSLFLSILLLNLKNYLT